MLTIKQSTRFRHDIKAAKKRGFDLMKMKPVLDLLVAEQPLPAKYQDHALSGTYVNFRECHIAPDWLLVYRIEHDTLELYLFRTGTHSDLF